VSARELDAEERAAAAIEAGWNDPATRRAWKAEAATMAAGAFAGCKPPKHTGLTRAARVGRIIAEDVRADRPVAATLRDVVEANRVTFEPPFADAKLEALARAKYAQLGVNVDG
jgi:hypothetical protein